MAPVAALVGDSQTGQEVADQIRLLGGTVARVVMAGVVTILAPVAEELMFRGILLKSLASRWITQCLTDIGGIFWWVPSVWPDR